MKRNLKYLFIVIASSLLLAGCCTSRHAMQWEYKIADIPGGKYHAHDQREIKEAFLNDMAKEGWTYLEQGANGDFYFKRPKK